MNPKITIVTATLNRAPVLKRCLDSVRNQRYQDYEHIVIDGGSTDGTVELLQKHQKDDHNLKWISEPDNGISEAFNKGLERMTGDCVAILGDDDLYLPNAFAIIAAAVNDHPDAGLWSGGAEFVNNSGEHLGFTTARFSNRRRLIQNWLGDVSLAAPSTFISRHAIEKAGNFREADRFAMDYRHWIEITRYFDVVVLPEILSQVRYDEGTVSFSQRRLQISETLKISREYWNDYGTITRLRIAASYVAWLPKDMKGRIFHWGVKKAPNCIKRLRRRILNLPGPQDSTT